MPAGENGYRAVARAVAGVDADAGGADHASVKAYEAGKREPGARYLMAFCRVTGCSGSWLLLNAGPMKAEPEDVRLARYGLVEAVLAGEMDKYIAGSIGPKGKGLKGKLPLGHKKSKSEATQPSG